MPNDSILSRFFQIKDLPERDIFFEPRRYEKFEKTICKFFQRLVKKYKELIQDLPLIFVIEDCEFADEISIELMRALNSSEIKGISILATYQDSISSIVNNPLDYFSKASDLLYHGNCYIMENMTDNKSVHELIKFNIDENLRINSVRQEVVDIVLSKSFRGNPMFIIDIMNSLLENLKYVKYPTGEVCATNELLHMYEHNDWSEFKIPIKMEKLIGNIIDNLKAKEIILLKHASVIGNMFDIDKLNDLNPFESITFEDLIAILSNLEAHGLIEVLYDLHPKQIVYKFSVPFLREILYQRMLIEQRNDIHLNIARKLQDAKFSYMPHYKETYQLQTHLRIAEKSIINYMEEDDDSIADSKDNQKQKCLSLNGMKILLVKDICERLRVIDLRLDSNEIDISKRSMPIIKSGATFKKSDKNITWEQ